jgi:hypothetical protein
MEELAGDLARAICWSIDGCEASADLQGDPAGPRQSREVSGLMGLA